ncbi:MAG: hypothetical protein Aureis2KO_04600 [Aureisphaera sp.]
MKHPIQSIRLFTLMVWLCGICCTLKAQDRVSKPSEDPFQLGKEAQKQGNHRNAITQFKLFLSTIDSTHSDASFRHYEAFNEIGISKQRLLELDSSSFYFRKALTYLDRTERTPMNEFYFAGILKNRIGLNEFNTGKMKASIQSMKAAVHSFQFYVDAVQDEEEKLNGLKKQYASVDNLGGFYRGIGENERGMALAEYSYRQKLSFLEEDDSNITISRLILGHINLIARNYEAAGTYLDQALAHIEKTPYLQTYGLMVRASTYENVGDYEKAQETYEECETIYRQGANGTYSLVFLDALIEMSRFYAKIGNREKAVALAQEGYQFTQGIDFTNELIAFYHIQNMAQVHFTLGNYEEAKVFSEEALDYYSSDRITAQSELDSIRNEIRKPSVLYLKTKSTYSLNSSNDEDSLLSLLKETQNALSILERQKTGISTEEDLATLLNDNSDLINFTKQLNWDLYNLTQEESYLDDLISLHESAIYTRIRSRLNLKDITFSNVPVSVLERESQLKEVLSSSLDDSESIDGFFKAQTSWNRFLDSLKNNYPLYHEMRYATIQKPINGIQEKLDEKITVIRYMFMEETLYAFVLNASQKSLVPLENAADIENHIKYVNSPSSDFNTVAASISHLYNILWKPIAHLVTTENVVVIPDQVLFNVSFDILTPNKISSYTELAENSLLAKHNLAYNYSLFLIENEPYESELRDNFVSFAPEFTAEMKDNYRRTLLDSVDLDKAYVSLLPQPFSIQTVEKYASQFDGVTYLNSASTKNAFTQNARNHKIIHIATHAESNNLNPELSRLIFAKDLTDSLATNYLHTYEIYNHNLASELTTLTACETGKPSFQPGEGMISLAHAFNYAGSKSILTSLWKIDEQSSNEIVDSFYAYLAKGLQKDVALRKAKLDYIANAQGRTQAPFYWSGLVLMGDPQSIELSSGFPIWGWALILVAGILLLWLLLKQRKRQL